MKYDMGTCLADYGFSFLEKVHEPMFLVNSSGLLLKINEAGRKFLRIAAVNERQIQDFHKSSFLKGLGRAYQRVSIGRGLQLIARRFPGSDLALVEVVRQHVP